MTFKTLDLAEPDKLLENHQKLGQYMATPIAGNTRQSNTRASQPVPSHVFDFRSGNDISSSILYTLGLVSQRSGQLAPLCLLLVCGVLHFFRYVYSEVTPYARPCLSCLSLLVVLLQDRPIITTLCSGCHCHPSQRWCLQLTAQYHLKIFSLYCSMLDHSVVHSHRGCVCRICD